jgi:spore maturation protein CgeB
MKLVVFGLSLSSSWGNGHATTYRALLRAFAERGHEVVFFEWDAPWYRSNRDLEQVDYCRLELYQQWEAVARKAIAECAEADAVLVGSYVDRGAAVIDALLGARVGPLYFYDIDTPITISRLRSGSTDYLRADQVQRFDAYLSFTGGPFLIEVVEGEFGARRAVPLYCAVDARRYVRTSPLPELQVDLAYMGTYAADRQPIVEDLLNAPARSLPERSFLVAGPQYPAEIAWSANVRLLEHVPPGLHATFYSSARWQLNATRHAMTAAGWSPSVRLFEAGAVGAAVISDNWSGLERFFTPGKEILLPGSAKEVVEILESFPDTERRALGTALQRRILAEHTSVQRAAELERYLSGHFEDSQIGVTQIDAQVA